MKILLSSAQRDWVQGERQLGGVFLTVDHDDASLQYSASKAVFYDTFNSSVQYWVRCSGRFGAGNNCYK